MSGSQVLPGSYPQSSVTGQVAIDFPKFGFQSTHRTDRTNGILAVIPIGINPTSAGHWEVEGFSVTVRMAILIGTVAAIQYWGRFGKLWAGVMVDQPATSPGQLSNWPPASFPSDLSTFDLLWDGATDPITTVNSNTSQVDSNYTLVNKLFTLPFPKAIKAGSQLEFALILTPSTVDPTLAPVIRSCNFAIHSAPR